MDDHARGDAARFFGGNGAVAENFEGLRNAYNHARSLPGSFVQLAREPMQ
jgi:hypothetical protein